MYIRIEFYIMSIAGFQKHLTENAFTSHYIEYRQDKFMNFPCGFFFLFLRKKISNFNHNYTLPILKRFYLTTLEMVKIWFFFRNLHYKDQFGSNKFADMEVLVHFHNIFLHQVFCQELCLHKIVPFDNF